MRLNRSIILTSNRFNRKISIIREFPNDFISNIAEENGDTIHFIDNFIRKITL